MKIRQLFLPRPLRVLFKKGRRAGVHARSVAMTLRLRAGFPRWVAAHLARRGLRGRVVVAKQGVLGVLTPGEYLRFTQGPKARARLLEEVENWSRMAEAGFADIIPRFMQLQDLPEGLVLATEPLLPIAREGHVGTMLPLVRRLATAATPLMHHGLPETVEEGLRFASEAGAARDESFISEDELRAAFARPLLTGLSHQDLHWRNVLQRNGEPVLVDLKKCEPGRLLCLDILNMACLSLAARTGGNVVSQAYAAQRRGWDDAELAPVLALVDLPRRAWGPAYFLHVAGLYRLRRQGKSGWGEEVLFRRVMEQDWRPA
jgi:hypothetical protein